GDPQQAIFGFAGSDDQSWTRIQEAIYPTVFPLSITYRCPQSHVALARKLVPQLEAAPDAAQGHLEVLSPTDIKHRTRPGDLILCRFTAPLIGLCLKLVIHSGIPAKVRGRDLCSMLVTLAKTVAVRASGDLSHAFPDTFLPALRAHVQRKVAIYEKDGKTSAIESILDRSLALEYCFDAFGSQCQRFDDFCRRIERLFDDEAPLTSHVILATIHRAKGDEADRVFLLKTDSMPATFLAEKDWQIQQEHNLLYVALTRSKGSLFLVLSPRRVSNWNLF
ncbi:MAG: ATP-binding domain-containing protein, partial [Synechococcaceae cyanobacterium SM2_3_2]|nr:ATP-binding domain-containing protein [Synechococcaceae cyanobacterium SM2_3_2]